MDCGRMMRPGFLYFVNWFLIFTLTTRTVEVFKDRVNEKDLPQWFRGHKVKLVTSLVMFMVMGAVISSLIFGILFMPWYLWPLALIGAMALVGVTFRNFSAASVVVFWPPFLILVQIVLWVFGRAR
jgi:hypothetical protein